MDRNWRQHVINRDPVSNMELPVTKANNPAVVSRPESKFIPKNPETAEHVPTDNLRGQAKLVRRSSALTNPRQQLIRRS